VSTCRCWHHLILDSTALPLEAGIAMIVDAARARFSAAHG
jgi:hypothetical protein